LETIDLHAHTTASDGSLTPAELVDLACQIGLKAMAITDHDTVAGVAEALSRGKEVGVEVVPGIEISAEFKTGTMHMLGYFIDPAHPALVSSLTKLQEARRNRNPKIVAKLNELGVDITMEEIEAVAGGEQIGRPHFAKVLESKGYVSSFNEAFDRYLAKGASAYMDKFRFTPAKAMDMILKAGGLPVLAHPFTLGFNEPEELEALISRMVDNGLAGLEVYYSEHTSEMNEKYLALAEKYDLCPTGGSDFHGNNKFKIELGRGMGNLAVPYAWLSCLRQRLNKGT